MAIDLLCSTGTAFLAASLQRSDDGGLLRTVHVVVRPMLGDVGAAALQAFPNALVVRPALLFELGGLHDDFAARVSNFLLSTMVARPGPHLPVLRPNEIDLGPELMAVWEQAVTTIDEADSFLKSLLQLVPKTDPDYADLAGWLQQLSAPERPTMDDVRLDVRDTIDDASHFDLLLVPFSKRYTPVSTNYVPKLPAQRAATYEPWSLYGILVPAAVNAIEA
jgi:hypothetical protein